MFDHDDLADDEFAELHALGNLSPVGEDELFGDESPSKAYISKAKNASGSTPVDLRLPENKHGMKVSSVMTDYATDIVTHYKQMSGIKNLRKATTPFCPEGTLDPKEWESRVSFLASAVQPRLKFCGCPGSLGLTLPNPVMIWVNT